MPVKCWTLVMSHKQRKTYEVKEDMKGDSPPDSVITKYVTTSSNRTLSLLNSQTF